MTNNAKNNSALISNTMLCEVSRLFENLEERPGPSWRLQQKQNLRVIDLLSIIEAIALHDTLYTLPANLSSDANSLKFRKKLIEEGIVQELDTSSNHQKIAESILNSLSKVKNPLKVAGSGDEIGKPINFSSSMRKAVSEFLLISEFKEKEKKAKKQQELNEQYYLMSLVPPRLDDTYDFFGEGGGSAEPLSADSFEIFGRSLIGWIEYYQSGAYEHCTSIIRDMYHVFAAEWFELPFWPESTRREFTSNFPNYFNKQTMGKLYSSLSKALECTIAELYDDHKEELAFIPPFASLVLDRSTNRDDVLNRVIEVREEYSGLREKLSKLENDRREATTIGDRLKFRKKQRYLLHEVASAFEKPSIVNLEGIIKYIPEVVKPATKPVDPSSYSANLFLLPIKQLISWWMRRPISPFFNLVDKLKDVKSYNDLIKRHFGDQVELPYPYRLR